MMSPNDGFEIDNDHKLRNYYRDKKSILKLSNRSQLLLVPFMHNNKLHYSFLYLLKQIMSFEVGDHQLQEDRLNTVDKLFDLLDSQTVSV